MNAIASVSSSVPTSPPPATSTASPGSFRAALRDAATRLAEGDHTLASFASLPRGERAVADPASLLRLQAEVYRTSYELDVAGRLVDRLTQAVKTTLQSQT